MSADSQLLDGERGEALQALATRLDLQARCEPYRDELWDRCELDLPVLHVDDFSGIPFLVDIAGVEEYQHRARLRARANDLYAAVTPIPEGYEAYARSRLGLPAVDFVQVTSGGPPLHVMRGCGEGAAFQHLVERARQAGGLVIHPFMGVEKVWDVARQLREAAGVPVTVVAPPPPVTWLANDKQIFGELVRALLGEQWLVEEQASREPPGLAGALLDLAQRHEWVGLKRLRCASAMGNQVYESRELRALGPAGVESRVRAFLERTEWPGDEDVLAVAWEQTDISPSTQLWIPPLGSGPPRLDGVHEQVLDGPEKVFVGSRVSTLPGPVDRALGDAALRLCAGLQAVGYVGRCSFDFLLLGDPRGDFELRLTECNGRWGGTSTPLNLVDRIFTGSRPRFRAQDVIDPVLVGMPFTEILDRVGDQAYDVRTGQGRFLFYNVGPLQDSGKLDVIAIGQTQDEAEIGLLEELPRLLGLSR